MVLNSVTGSYRNDMLRQISEAVKIKRNKNCLKKRSPVHLAHLVARLLPVHKVPSYCASTTRICWFGGHWSSMVDLKVPLHTFIASTLTSNSDDEVKAGRPVRIMKN